MVSVTQTKCIALAKLGFKSLIIKLVGLSWYKYYIFLKPFKGVRISQTTRGLELKKLGADSGAESMPVLSPFREISNILIPVLRLKFWKVAIGYISLFLSY